MLGRAPTWRIGCDYDSSTTFVEIVPSSPPDRPAPAAPAPSALAPSASTPSASESVAAPAPAVPRPRRRAVVSPITPHLYVPTALRPMRAKRHALDADMEVLPHAHAWAQIAYSATGVVRVSAARGTFLVPPSRAVWIPPGVQHAIASIEDCELRTIYLHQAAGASGPRAALAAGPARPDPADGTEPRQDDDIDASAIWSVCRVLEVTELLRALLLALPTVPDDVALPPEDLDRERLIAPLVVNELCRARPIPLGVPLPAEKRLRALCEAILDDPGRHDTLDDWSRDAGASARTLARLFRQELDTSFHQWRQQAVLARALTLAAQGWPMNRIAATLGYASPSAFSAMVRRSVGAPPSRFFSSR